MSFGLVSFWPWIRDLWSKEAKDVEKDLKGDNNRWDADELWSRHSLRVARGCFVGLWFILFMKMFGQDYPSYIWMSLFAGLFGASGFAAWFQRNGEKKGA